MTLPLVTETPVVRLGRADRLPVARGPYCTPIADKADHIVIVCAGVCETRCSSLRMANVEWWD